MQRIGRYEVLQELGHGAMGAVYQARDPEIGRIVAIKTILTSAIPAEELPQFKQRFRREAQLAGQMSHPGIVTIHDISEDESGQPFLVMEFLEGVTLHRLLQPAADGTLPERPPLSQSLAIAVQVAEALDYAHQRGVVHRDIKPSNIIVAPDGRIKITDFGIAKFTGSETTSTAFVVGTPAYMSPEQVRGTRVDTRSDLFSLGAMLYWMCTGQKAFPGDTSTAISFKIVFLDPVPPRQLVSDIPRDLETILSRCLAKDPDQRYASARELAKDLAALHDSRPIATTPAPSALPADLGSGEETAIQPRVANLAARREDSIAGIDAAAAEATSRAQRGVSQWLGRPQNFAAVVSALLLLILAGYWLRPAADSPANAPSTGGTAAPGAPVGSRGAPPRSVQPGASQPAPLRETQVFGAEKAEPAAAIAASPRLKSQPASKPASTLEIECNHNFKEAALEIYAGKKKLFAKRLENKVQWKDSSAIAAGQQILRVHVASERDKFEDEKEITGDFAANGSRKLIIEFGRGSWLGLTKRKLTLHWK